MRWQDREPFQLVVLLFLVVAFFAGTTVLVNRYRSHQLEMGKIWFDRGENDLRDSNPDAAISDLRNALHFEGDNRQYRLRLVDALLAAGRNDQARAYLLSMREEQPASGIINLQLARLAATRGDIPGAKRYFNNAIYGVWEDDPMLRRREVRFELAKFLIAHRAYSDAQADLLVLTGNLPPEGDSYAQVGQLFLKADDPGDALARYRDALRLGDRTPDVLAGAGAAAFQLADYPAAVEYLSEATQNNPSDAESAHMLSLARLVLTSDPLDHRLTAIERSRRTVAAFGQAMQRLQQCAAQVNEPLDQPPTSQLQALYAEATALGKSVSVRKLYRDPDLLDDTAQTAFRIETVAAQRCGTPMGLDEALLLISRRHAEGK